MDKDFNDFTYHGFFAWNEEKNRTVSIMLYTDKKDFKELEGHNRYNYGDLFISADGNYIEMNIERIFSVAELYYDTQADRLDNDKSVVFIGSAPIICISRWFKKARAPYYEADTRIIRDVTNKHFLVTKILNHATKLYS